MSELRWNPLLQTWTMVASNRKARPTMPKDWCPFCPGEGKPVGDNYTVLAYNNDFPALTQQPEAPYEDEVGFYQSKENYGKCEVILYSPEHEAKFYDLSNDHVVELLELIKERCQLMAQDEKIKYVYPFENKGEAVGVTMPHPHGQLYGYSYVPQKIQVELEGARVHHEHHGTCLICDMNKAEAEFGGRIVGETDTWVAYIPFFTDYPYGVFAVPKRHISYLWECTEEETKDLAKLLRTLTSAFDHLFDAPFPYMMVYHQHPVNSPEYEAAKDFYHFHIEFYPPFREANKIKFYASSEMGAWAAANTSAVEETALELRACYDKAAAEIGD